jgi:hypothetical protein
VYKLKLMIPIDPKFAPDLNVKVFDVRGHGFIKFMVSSGSLPLASLLPWNYEPYLQSLKRAGVDPNMRSHSENDIGRLMDANAEAMEDIEEEEIEEEAIARDENAPLLASPSPATLSPGTSNSGARSPSQRSDAPATPSPMPSPGLGPTAIPATASLNTDGTDGAEGPRTRSRIGGSKAGSASLCSEPKKRRPSRYLSLGDDSDDDDAAAAQAQADIETEKVVIEDWRAGWLLDRVSHSHCAFVYPQGRCGFSLFRVD